MLLQVINSWNMFCISLAWACIWFTVILCIHTLNKTRAYNVLLSGKPPSCALINKTQTIHLTGQTSSSIILMGRTELNRFKPNLLPSPLYTCRPALKGLLERAHEERGIFLGGIRGSQIIPLMPSVGEFRCDHLKAAHGIFKAPQSSVFISDTSSCWVPEQGHQTSTLLRHLLH